MFLEKVYEIYGNNWNEIARFIPKRNSEQVRSHAQKLFNKQ